LHEINVDMIVMYNSGRWVI